jgi:hypothetical protein
MWPLFAKFSGLPVIWETIMSNNAGCVRGESKINQGHE